MPRLWHPAAALRRFAPVIGQRISEGARGHGAYGLTSRTRPRISGNEALAQCPQHGGHRRGGPRLGSKAFFGRCRDRPARKRGIEPLLKPPPSVAETWKAGDGAAGAHISVQPSGAKQQTSITESELSITVQANTGKADLARAQQQAAQIQALAEAESEKIRVLGEGEAKKIQALAGAEAERAARVGVAQALAIEEQVRAYGGPRFQLTQQVMARFAEAIEQARVDVVPKILISGGAGNTETPGGGFGSGSVVEALLSMLLSERMEASGEAGKPPPPRPQAEALRKELEGRISGGSAGGR
jgi:hypothetical protein